MVFQVQVGVGPCNYTKVIGGGFEGWTLGISYTFKYSEDHCGISRAHGLFNYNIFFEGIGTVYADPVTHDLVPVCE